MYTKRLDLLFLSVVLLSCTSAKVKHTESTPGFQLSNYGTYDFYELEASGDTTANFEKNAALIKDAIARNLKTRGLVRNETRPELLINIGIVVEEKTQTRETTIREAPRYMGQRRYSWKSEEIEIGKYKTGTATVHLVDADSEKMVWRGVVEGVIPNKERKIPASIDEGVDALFSRL